MPNVQINAQPARRGTRPADRVTLLALITAGLAVLSIHVIRLRFRRAAARRDWEAANPVLKTPRWRSHVQWLMVRPRDEWVITLVAAALSLAFYGWYASHGMTLAYADAISHMMIARRMLAGPVHGLTQLGTAWLPFNHMLMAPLIWNNTLFRDGFAGAFPSMVAYVISAVYLYRTGRLLFASRLSGWIAALIFVSNPSVLYMQSTAMSELILLCTMIIGVYYLVCWAHAWRPGDLGKASAAIAAATLVRYDGWALAAAALVVVIYVAWQRWHQAMIAEAYTILFGGVAFAGCMVWCLYNAVIFHNPLAFYDGPYSARSEQQRLAAAGALPTFHNFGLSLRAYGQSVVGTVGAPIAVLALLGLVMCVLRFRFRLKTVPAYLLLMPFAFNWTSLFLGVTTQSLPELHSAGMGLYLNERYGMMMIPAVAIFLASWATIRRLTLAMIVVVVVSVSTFNLSLATPYAVRDPLYGANWHSQNLARQESAWLAEHYHGGKVLVSYSAFAPMMFYSGLSDQAFVTDASGRQFLSALADPQNSVAWIVMDAHSDTYDAVYATLRQRREWRRDFALRQVIGSVQIYERVSTG